MLKQGFITKQAFKKYIKFFLKCIKRQFKWHCFLECRDGVIAKRMNIEIMKKEYYLKNKPHWNKVLILLSP